MSGGGGGAVPWKAVLAVGLVVCGAAFGLHHHAPEWLVITLSAVGGLMTVFGSCEAMILCVDGLGERLRWNPFVAGTMAGLASNVPELVMLGFVIAQEPRVAFVVSCLTLHVNALVFGVYSALLPKDKSGHAHLPEAITKQGTDLILCGAGLFMATGMLMLAMRAFEMGDHRGEGLGKGDLLAMGIGLLLVQVTAVLDLIKRFAAAPAQPGAAPVPAGAQPGDAAPAPVAPSAAADPSAAAEHGAEPPPSWGKVLGFGALGICTSVVGGHAVGDFADGLVDALNERQYPEMVGAIVVSLFAGVASYLMVATAHMKGKFDVALSNVSGAVTQVPFVILPGTMLLMALLAQLGVIPMLPHGAVLAIDLETTTVVMFGAPTMLVLWHSIQDDGKVNPLETTIMVVVFGLIIYFLGAHG